jgi:serine/threonine protein kinase/WD40 repeat protein
MPAQLPPQDDFDDRDSRLALLLETFDERLAQVEGHSTDHIEGMPLPEFDFDLREIGIDLCDCLQGLERLRRDTLAAPDLNSVWPTVTHADFLPAPATRPVGLPVNADLQPPPQETPLLPFRLEHFQVLRELGRGGHGVVYLAFDLRIRRYVAIKYPLPEILADSRRLERFVLESRAAGMLNHPNIVRILEVGEDQHLPHIVSEYVSGPNLAYWLAGQQAPIEPRLAARLIANLARGVGHAHQQGVVHRDIKPGNVLLQRTQGRGNLPPEFQLIPRLTDFGVARVESSTGLTRTGEIMGTPAYLSPEQARGQVNDVGPRSDIFSLGSLLYEFLIGRPAFSGENDLAILTKVSKAEFTPPRRVNPAIPRELEAICLKCMQLDPAERYATAEELADDLHRFLDGYPIRARRDPPLTYFWKLCRRYPYLALSTTASFLLLIALLAESLWQNSRVSAALAQARRNHEVALEHQELAVKRAELLLKQTYLNDMQRAGEAWNSNHLETMLRILSRYIPQPHETDLRDFGWWYLWNASHQYSKVIGSHNRGVTALAATSVTPCIAATSGEDAIIKLWNIPQGKLIGELTGHAPGPVNSLEFSPDGKLLVSTGDDGSVRVWNVPERKLKHLLLGHTGWAAAAKLSPDQSLIATAGEDKLIRLWNAESGQPIATMSGHTDTVRALGFVPDSDWLVSSSEDDTVRLWNWKTATPETNDGKLPDGLFTGHTPEWGDSVEFDPAAKTLAVANVGLWSLRSKNFGKLLAKFPDPFRIRAAKWLKDGRLILARQDSVIRIAPGQNHLEDTSAILRGHLRDDVMDVAVLPEEQGLLSIGVDGQIRLWSTPSLKGDLTLDPRQPDPPASLNWHGDILEYAIPLDAEKSTFGAFRMPRRQELWKWDCTANRRNTCFAVTPAGNQAWVIGNNLLSVYPLPSVNQPDNTPQWTRKLELPESPVTTTPGIEPPAPLPNLIEQIEFDPTGRFACVKARYTALLLSTRDAKILATCQTDRALADCRFLKKHPLLLLSCDDGKMRTWNLTQFDKPNAAPLPPIEHHVFDRDSLGFAVSPDETLVAGTFAGRATVIWSFPDWKQLAHITHQTYNSDDRPYFVDDGRTLLFHDVGERRLRLYDWKHDHEFLSLEIHSPRAIETSPDATQLAITTEHGINFHKTPSR